MTNTFFFTIKIAAITFLLSAAACNDTNATSETSDSMNPATDTAANKVTPITSTVMNVEGTGTVEARQIQGTDGSGGAPGSDAVMSSSPATTATDNASKK